MSIVLTRKKPGLTFTIFLLIASGIFVGSCSEVKIRRDLFSKLEICNFWGKGLNDQEVVYGFEKMIDADCTKYRKELTCSDEGLKPEPGALYPFCVSETCEGSTEKSNVKFVTFRSDFENWGNPSDYKDQLIGLTPLNNYDNSPSCRSISAAALNWSTKTNPATAAIQCLCEKPVECPAPQVFVRESLKCEDCTPPKGHIAKSNGEGECADCSTLVPPQYLNGKVCTTTPPAGSPTPTVTGPAAPTVTPTTPNTPTPMPTPIVIIIPNPLLPTSTPRANLRTTPTITLTSTPARTPTPTLTVAPTNTPPDLNAKKTWVGKKIDAQTILSGNPYMGWVLETTEAIEGIPFRKCNELEPGGNFYPEFEVIEILSTWGDIERVEGTMDWSRLDKVVQFWQGKGKRLRLRISNDDIGPYYPTITIPGRRGTPEWLYDQYHVDRQIRNYDGAQGWSFPNIGNAIYQQKLGIFLNKLAEKYKNNSAIELISIRGYGAWGEWHDGFAFSSESERVRALQGMIDLWMQAWRGSGKLLSLPVSIDCGNSGWDWDSPECKKLKNDSDQYGRFKNLSAYDMALTIPSLTLNKDCVGFCTTPNEYKLLEESFNSKALPLNGEYGGFYKDFKNGSSSRSLTFAEADVYQQRLNYITALGWSCDQVGHDADDFYREEKSLIKRIMLKLGYRLAIDQIVLPEFLWGGESFDVVHSWSNSGVGRLYGDFALKVYFEAADGQTKWEGMDQNLNLTGILHGNGPQNFTSHFNLESQIAPGSYTVKWALVDRNRGLPIIKLANEDRDTLGRYKLGQIEILSGQARPTVTPTPGQLAIEFKTVTGGGSFGSGTVSTSVIPSSAGPTLKCLNPYVNPSECKGRYGSGAIIHLTAWPITGDFGGWTGACVSSVASCTMIMPSSDIKVIATFNPPNTPTPTPTATPTISPFSFKFGVNHFWLPIRPYVEKIAELHNSSNPLSNIWVRIDFPWDTIEPTKGNLKFNDIETGINNAINNPTGKINILGVLVYSANWSINKDCLQKNPGTNEPKVDPETGKFVPIEGKGWYECEPANNQDYANFVKGVVNKFKDRVHYWEVWNEPNYDAFWKVPNPEKFTELLKVAYAAIKSVDPTATVLNGGIGFDYTSEMPFEASYAFINKIYEHGGKEVFDALAVHHYRQQSPWSSGSSSDNLLRNQIDRLKSIMSQYGDSNKKIWITETGWNVGGGPMPPILLPDQAAFLTNFFNQVQAINTFYTEPPIEAVFWYQLTDACANSNNSLCRFGLTEQPPSPTGVLNERPAFGAYKT